MKASHITAFVVVLLAGGVSSLWLLLRDESTESAVIDVHVDGPGEEREVADMDATEVSDAEAEFVGAPATAAAREAVAPLREAAASAADLGPADILRGRLRDEYTAEALPEFMLIVHDAAGHREEVTTDAQGNFATSSNMLLGNLSIAFPDRPGRTASAPAQSLEHRAADQSLDLSVACGPTFWLDLQPAREIDVTNLDTRLQFMGRDAAGNDARLTSDLEPVRTGEGAWVRFGPLDALGAVNAESIEVTSRDGYWRGRARVQELHGRVPTIVPVKLATYAVLNVHVAALDGAPIEGADFFLNWTSSTGKAGKSNGRSDAQGVFTFKYLAAGDGELAARSLFHGPVDVPIRLVERESANVELAMPALPAAGAIRGRIVSDTGTYAPRIEVVLNAPASSSSNGKGPAAARTTPDWRTVDGKSVGAFSFEGLPKGKYRIEVARKDDFFRWEPGRLELDAPSEAAVFVVHDAVPNAGIAFRVRDGDNGLLLDGLRITLDVRNGPSRIHSASSNQVLYAHVPYDRKLTWRVDKDGYQPAFGDDAGFIAEEMRGEEKVRCAEVNLDPGWGDVFRVAFGQKNGGTPLEGAHVLLDGRDAGVTRKDGTVRVFAKRKPTQVTVTYKDWIVVGKINLSPPWSRPDRNFVRVEMKQPPPKKKGPGK